jgi:hypothetical protein
MGRHYPGSNLEHQIVVHTTLCANDKRDEDHDGCVVSVIVIRRVRVSEIEVTEKRTRDANGIRAPGEGHSHERVIDQSINSAIFEQSPSVSCRPDVGFPIERDLDVCVTIEVLHQTFDAYNVSR